MSEYIVCPFCYKLLSQSEYVNVGGTCRQEDSGEWKYPFRCPHTGESYDYEGDIMRFCPRCGREIEA